MACHICSQEAVGRCFNCGQLFCADHGSENCTRCDTAAQPATRVKIASAVCACTT